jgi:histone-arginine methyltransferase CARM1
MHGFAGWFDISFIGLASTVVLSTAPELPGTHWYQCRLLLKDPIAVNRGQTISGSFTFRANEFFSYYIDMVVRLDGTDIVSYNTINLKDQQYSYLQQHS